MANGYLFVPGNGTAAPPAWASGDPGTVGAIVGGPWYETEGAGAYSIKNETSTGTPTAGTYELEMSVQPTSEGNDVRVRLEKDDGSYLYEAAVIDETPAATSFNSIVFATNNSATTELTIEALEVTMGAPIEVSTGVEEDRTGLPDAFALGQNYPNPFNPTTNIKFELPQAADVRLDVFNLLGQKVKTLVSGRMSAGVHEVSFEGHGLASGIYIYRIEAADFVSTMKMTLVK